MRNQSLQPLNQSFDENASANTPTAGATTLLRRLSLGFKANLIIITIFGTLLIVSVLLINLITNTMVKHIGHQLGHQEALLVQSQMEQTAQLLVKDSVLLANAPGLVEIVRQEDEKGAADFLISSSVPDYFTDIDLFNSAGERIVDLDEETTTEQLDIQEDKLRQIAMTGQNVTAIRLDDDDDDEEDDEETTSSPEEAEEEGSLELLLSVGVPVSAPETGEIIGAITTGRIMDEAFLESLVFGKEGVGVLCFYENELVTSALNGIGVEDTAGDNAQGDIVANAIKLTNAQHTQAQDITIGEQPLVLDNVPYALGYVPLMLEGPNLADTRLVILISLQPLTAFQNQLTTALMLAFSLLIVLGLLVMSFFIRGSVTAPLRKLQVAVGTIANGDYQQRVAVTTEDEVGKLGHAFNTMTTRLKDLHSNLTERNTELSLALDDARTARETAERANTMKSQFLANMSHELRTPLNSIINFTYMVSQGLFGPVNEEQVSFLNRIQTNGQHLLGLINDILDISKIEAGRLTLCKESVQLDELIHGIMSTAIGLTREKPITLQQEIAPDLPPITIDRTRIRQVLLNLLSNAAKYTDEGTITVQAGCKGQEVVISVIDTGIGIPLEDQERIFGEFQQVEGGSNRRYEGTGLGLAISQRLVQMHSGRIWVESNPGIGSTFFVSLPIGEAEEEPVEISSEPLTANTNGIKVLVIDDDQSAIDIISTYLGQDGYAVYGLTDSRRALEEVHNLQPAIIILDILMPHRDGWETLADLKSDPASAFIPVVLYTVVREEQLGMHLGASAYMVKPISEEQLRRTVTQLAHHNAQVLVIDDNADVLDIVSHYLKRMNGYRVVTANGGRAGLDIIAAHRPDLIILDLMMPDIDGFAVLEELDQAPDRCSIPVVVLTAKDLTPEEQRFLHTRVDELVIKNGSTPDQWMSHVQAALQKHIEPET